MGSHYAAALHYELKYKRFGVKAQVSKYKKSSKNLTDKAIILLPWHMVALI
jgi:hypothetical protein